MKDLLYEKFVAVPTRPGRGGTYSYIKWQDVADRMNKIFGTNWSSEVVYQDVIGTNIVVRVRVTINDSTTNNKFRQEGFGGAPMDDRQEAGNPFKSAYSKALKDACKKWGIGLYIDEDDQDSVVPDKIPVNIPVTSLNNSVTPSAIPPVVDKESPVTHTTITGTTSTKPETPPTPPSSPSSVGATPAIPPGMPALPDIKPEVSNVSVDTQTAISDVQKAALQSILNIQGVEYEDLVRRAFDAKKIVLSGAVPIMDDLSYDEAVTVVKYGNDNFRKR